MKKMATLKLLVKRCYVTLKRLMQHCYRNNDLKCILLAL